MTNLTVLSRSRPRQIWLSWCIPTFDPPSVWVKIINTPKMDDKSKVTELSLSNCLSKIIYNYLCLSDSTIVIYNKIYLYLSIYKLTISIYNYLFLSKHICIYLYFPISVYNCLVLSTIIYLYLSIYPSIHLFIYLSTVSLSLSLSLPPSLPPSIHYLSNPI